MDMNMNTNTVNKTEVVLQPGQGETMLRLGAAKRLHEFKGLHFEAHSTKSFAELVGWGQNGTRTLVFTHPDGFDAILDTGVQDRPQDTVSHAFTLSVLAKEWEKVLTRGGVFGIKDLADFLKRRTPGEIDRIEDLLYAVQNFRYVTSIAGDFSFEDRNNYSFAVKINEAETTVKVPKVFVVTLEILNESGFPQSLEIEVEVHRPKGETEKPGFLLSCPKWGRYFEEAKAHEVETLKGLLAETGVLVVSGTPKE